MSRNAIRVMERLPLVIFGMMYVISCYLGVMLLLLSTDFWAWTNYFTGVRLPSLTLGNLVTLLILLYGGPIFLWGGYELGCALSKHHWRREETETTHREERATKIAMALYFISVGLAVWSLFRGGAFSRLADWTDYNSYVLSRWHLFSTLTFFEYVNIYTWLPLLSAYLILSKRKWWVIVPLVGVISFLQVSLFMRKALLTSVLMIFAASWAYLYLGEDPRMAVKSRVSGYWLLAGGITLSLIFAVLTVISIPSGVLRMMEPKRALNVHEVVQKHSIDEAQDVAKADADDHGEEFTEEILIRFDKRTVPDLVVSVGPYVVLAALTRTSVPSIAYAVLFPKHIPYYHLDFALDILGVGRMPDDNRTVSSSLWPKQRGGSVAVPFHFVLYSQGGMGVAFVGSFVVGVLLALLWRTAIFCERITVERSLVISLVLVFAWFLSIDSIRNSLLVSYGVLWGALLVFALGLLKYRKTHEYPVPTLSRKGGA